MKVPVISEIIAGLVSLVSAAGTLEFGPDERERESNQAARDRKRSTKPAAQRKSEISNFSEPLPRSAYDLQSRLTTL